jgi:hypothetical protein
MFVPVDFFRSPVTERSLYDLDGDTIQPDVLPEKAGSHGLYRDNVPGITGSPDTKSPCICTDIKEPVMGRQVIEPVFRYFKDLAEGCILQEKSDAIR